MAPIRTAIVGLSAGSFSSWASRAHLPYLLSPAGKSKFQIVALLNSSVDAAKRAIEKFGLPAETRAYGSPEDLAADTDVEFVVVNTRVDKHYEVALPSVRAGKDVYVEWPLAHNAAKAGELAALAKEKGGKTVVGLQGRFAPPVVKLKEVIESGLIGKVLSSDVIGFGGLAHRSTVLISMKYSTQRKVGGNFVSIGYGHLSDYVQYTLGDIQNIQSQLQIQRPDVKVKDPSTGEIIETVKSDVPDLVHVTGTLPSSKYIVQGATLRIRLRQGQPFKGEPGLVWTIYGEKGEIRLVAPSGPSIQAFAESKESVTIDVELFEKDDIQKVEWDYGRFSELPVFSRNIGALYEAYADGDTSKYADFEHAVKRHNLLEKILSDFDAANTA